MMEFVQTTLAHLRARVRRSLRGRYPSHELALEACQERGYEGQSLVEVVAAKTLTYRKSLCDPTNPLALSEADSRILLALASCGAGVRPVSVIDIGGACGSHFYRAVRFFGRNTPIQWHVVETPAMVRTAEIYGFSEEIHFYSSLDDASHDTSPADLVLCSGALQYLPDPERSLRQLLAHVGRFLCIARVPVATTQDLFFCTQTTRLSANGPGLLPSGFTDRNITYPMAIIPASTIESFLKSGAFQVSVLEDSDLLYHPDTGYLPFRTYLAGSVLTSTARETQ